MTKTKEEQMETWTREQIKADPVLLKLLQLILSKHETPGHTIKHLMELMHVDNVCELTTQFLVLPAGKAPAVYLSYEFNTWIKVIDGKLTFPTRVEAINVFENFVEYEATRIKELSAAAPDDRDTESLNLN
jgi:hypothetical protein